MSNESLTDMLSEEAGNWADDVARQGTDPKSSSPQAAKAVESDDVVTSAPPKAEVGSLLSDLLSEAKKEVAKERESLNLQLREKENADRLAVQRDEARKREAMQQKLMAETRRRNEALNRKEKEEAAERAAANPAPVLAAIVAAPAPMPPQKQSRGPLLAAVAFVLIVGGAFAGWMALQPKPPLDLPDLRANAATVVESTSVQWMANQERAARIAAEENAESERIARLAAEKQTKEAKAVAAKAEADRLELEAQAAQAAIEGQKKRDPTRSGKRSGKKGGKKGGLTLKKGVF